LKLEGAIIMFSRRNTEGLLNDQDLLTKAGHIARQLKCEGRFNDTRQSIDEKNPPNLKHIINLLGTAWKLAKAQDHAGVVDEKTKEKLLQELQDSELPLTHKINDFECFHQLFEKHVEENPNKIALIYNDIELSYKILNDQINQLASHLIALKNTNSWNKEMCIGLFFENTPEAVISIVAAMKAGLAYVPLTIDEKLPYERLATYVESSRIQLIITQTNLIDHDFVYYIKNKNAALTVHAYGDLKNATQSVANPSEEVKPDQLAYIIFSSGSTGAPKGIGVAHRGLCNPALAVNAVFNIDPNKDRIGWYSLLTFDASLLDIMTALGTGATSVIIPQEIRKKSDLLKNYLIDKRVTIITLVPSVLEELNPKELSGLRGIISTGETAKETLFTNWLIEGRPEGSPRVILNGYGPTEATICTSLGQYQPGKIVNIGQQPIRGLQWYILQPGTEEEPYPREPSKVNDGEEGELYLAGEGLALGYLDTDAHYQQRFRAIFNPNDPHKLLWVYQTGDIVRLHDNTMQFVRRLDAQFKFFGELIHPSAIEAALLEYKQSDQPILSNIKVIIEKKNDRPFIHAYLQLHPDLNTDFPEKLIREIYFYLRHHKNCNLVPSRFCLIEEWPMNVNGKLDDKKLPEKTIKTFYSQSAFQLPPHQVIEHQIAEFWYDILEIPKEHKTIYLDDDFYELGGNSILTTILLERVQKAYPKYVKDFGIFNAYPTLRNVIFQVQLADEDSGIKEILKQCVQWIEGKEKFITSTSVKSFPVILVHSVTGDATIDYKNVIENWQESLQDWPLLGVRAPSLDNPSYITKSIPQLASNYLKLLNEELKNYSGPLILVGYSAGGTIAYEMAKQLQRINRLATVCCIDTPSTMYYQTLPQTDYAKEIFDLMRHSVNKMMGIDLDNHGITFDELQQYPKREQLRIYWRRLQERLTDKTPGNKEKYLGIYMTLHNIISYHLDYKPAFVKNASLFVFTDTVQKKHLGDQLGWELPLKTIEIKGEHLWLAQTSRQPWVKESFMPRLKEFVIDSQNSLISLQKINDLLPTIEQLKESYLNNQQNSQLQYDAKTTLPIDHGFINLTLVHSMSNTSNSPSINLENLFLKIQKPFAKTLILGNLGTGKTTLCKYIANQWAKGNLLKHYDIVVWKQLSNIESNLEDLKNIIDKFKGTKPGNILFLFDGYDELDKKTKTASYVQEMLNSNNYSIMLTSRVLDGSLNLYGFDHYVIAGFNDDNMEQYITTYFHQINRNMNLVTPSHNNHSNQNNLSLENKQATDPTNNNQKVSFPEETAIPDLGSSQENSYGQLLNFIKKDPRLNEFSRIPLHLSLLVKYWLACIQQHKEFDTSTQSLDLLNFAIPELWKIYVKRLEQENSNNEAIDKMQTLLENIAAQVWLAKSSDKIITRGCLRDTIFNYCTSEGNYPNEVEIQKVIQDLLYSGFINADHACRDQFDNLQMFFFFHPKAHEHLTVAYLLKHLNYENKDKFVQFTTLIDEQPVLYNIIRKNDDNEALKMLFELRTMKGLTDSDKTVILKCLDENPSPNKQSLLYNVILSRIGEDGIERINTELQDMYKNDDIIDEYNFNSLLIQIYNYKPDNSVIKYLKQSDDFFKGKIFLLSDPKGIFTNSAEIKSVHKLYPWNEGKTRFSLEDHSEITLQLRNNHFDKVFVARRMPHLLITYLKNYYDFSKHTEIVIGNESFQGTHLIPNGRYVLTKKQHKPSRFSSLYAVFSLALLVKPRYEIHLHATKSGDINQIEIVDIRNLTLKKINIKSEQFESYQVHVLVNNLVEGITSENAKDKMKIKPKIEDENKVKLKKLEEIENYRNDIRKVLIEDKSNNYLNNILDDLIKNGLKKISDEIIDEVKDKILFLKEKLDKIISLSDEIGIKSTINETLIDIALLANYEKLVSKDYNIDVLQVMKLLKNAFEHIEKMTGKALVLIEGNTGSGKSTMVNYLIGVQQQKCQNKYGRDVIEVSENKNIDHTKYAKIGQSIAMSETIFTQGYQLIKAVKELPKNLQLEAIMMADSAGSKDTRGKDYELVTALSRDHVVKNAGSIQAVVLIAPYDYFLIDRATLIIDLFDSLQKKIKNAFSDPKLSPSIFLAITKHDTYPNVIDNFNTLLDDLLTNEQKQLQQLLKDYGNHPSDDHNPTSVVQNRITIWESLKTMWEGDRIDFINIDNTPLRTKILRRYIKNSVINKEAFVKAMDQDFIQRHFGKYIQMLIDTWKHQIIDCYLKSIPSEINRINKEITSLQNGYKNLQNKNCELGNSILARRDDINIMLSIKEELTKILAGNNFENNDVIQKIKNESKRLKNDDLTRKINEKNLLTNEISNKKNEYYGEKNENALILSNTKNLHDEIKQLNDQIKNWSTGTQDIKLWKFEMNPEEILTYSIAKEGALQQAFDEFRYVNSEEVEKKVNVIAKEYSGCLYHSALISEEYCIVPKDENQRKNFLASQQAGQYLAIMTGNFEIAYGKKASDSGKKILYSLKSSWCPGQAIPTCTITHTIPNAEINDAIIANAKPKIKENQKTIETNKGRLTESAHKMNYLKNEINSKVQEVNTLINSIKEIEQRAIKEGIRATIAQYTNSINDCEKSIQKHQAEIRRTQDEMARLISVIKDNDSKLQQQYRLKKHYAIIVKTQLNIAELLRKFTELAVDDQLIDKPNAHGDLYQECQDFIKYYDEHIQQLKITCESDLGVVLPIKSPAQAQSHLPAEIGFFGNRPALPVLPSPSNATDPKPSAVKN
jgi:non-ribosomal peptide synthetase component F/thioesterase domain-containing protein/energy-coupling factor transporter ATP-binding protein EcfA2